VKIYRSATYMIDDDGKLVLLSADTYDYSGPLVLAKKGDKTKGVGKEQEAYGNKEQGIQDTARSKADSFYSSLMPGAVSGNPSTTSTGGDVTMGQMSPYAAANYGSSVENIANTYNNLRQAGFRALGAKGFGNAPSGFGASMENTLNKGEAEAQTGAFRTGLNETLNEGLKGAEYFTGEQQMYNPNAAYSGASSSYTNADQLANQAWKTGIGAATGVASMFVPGGGFASLLNKGGGGGVPSSVPGGGMGDILASNPSLLGGPAYNPSSPGFGSLSKYANTGPSAYSTVGR